MAVIWPELFSDLFFPLHYRLFLMVAANWLANYVYLCSILILGKLAASNAVCVAACDDAWHYHGLKIMYSKGFQTKIININSVKCAVNSYRCLYGV